MMMTSESFIRKKSFSAIQIPRFQGSKPWPDKSSELGPVSPARFIPELDRANLTVPFGRLILHKVLADYRRLRQIYGDSITINISPLFFMDEGFTEFCSDRGR